jgi:hypothetical protein
MKTIANARPSIRPGKPRSRNVADDIFTADTTEHFDWSRARRLVFPRLKPTTTPIAIRLPETLLTDLKRLANEQHCPVSESDESLPGRTRRPRDPSPPKGERLTSLSEARA